jgi:hypothetical protein
MFCLICLITVPWGSKHVAMYNAIYYTESDFILGEPCNNRMILLSNQHTSWVNRKYRTVNPHPRAESENVFPKHLQKVFIDNNGDI